MAWNLPESGEIVRLREVIGRAPQMTGHAVRVMARLESYDCMKQQAVIRSAERNYSHHLLVDTRLIEPFEARPGSMLQFLGEVDCTCAAGDDQIVLRARVVRCVDGVDVALYYKALDEQRRFFERRNQLDTETMQT